ncbi:hypothetical protein DE146DRAFT_673097 [Phaeosphaeria sp. MPI-PUGE-AT-0046c]|nr:hypothetical protein DE146DRAFT_673097 [Phaeosphaeria sp. MPI-PUGE-AT-0046c]
MSGCMPLIGIVSVYDDYYGLTGEFIAVGAEINHKDQASRPPMHYAANRILVEILQGLGADLFARDNYGMTSFHTACRAG